MENIAEESLHILAQRWPALAASVRLAQPPSELLWVSAGKDPTLEVKGLRLWSAYDPKAEAMIQAELVPQDSPVAWVYGIGGGDLIRTLLERPALRRLTVVPLNLGLFHLLLHMIDNRDWLSDERVQLRDPAYERDVSLPFAAIPPCLLLADGKTQQLRARVDQALLAPFERARLEKRAPMRRSQMQQNLALVREDGDVATLFDTSPGHAAFVALAGPTLRKTAPWIAGQRTEGHLIAVDGALQPLLELGLIPEFVLSLDDNRDSVVRYFDGNLADCADSTLIYAPIVHNDILTRWPGRRLCMYTAESIYDEVKQLHPRGELFSAGSVSHPTIDLSTRMGAVRVYLFGADFGFPAGQIHANDEAPVDAYSNAAKSGETALDGHGKTISTLASFNSYRIELERYIEDRPRIDFVNMSRDGAAIAGTRYLDADSG